MPNDRSHYQIGNVGDGTTILQGKYLNHITVQVQDAKEAGAILHSLREQGERPYHGPLLRRLDPIVLVNRGDQLAEITRFFEETPSSMLFVVGLAGIGKSTLVRGALEFRPPNIPAVWINCKRLEAEQLLADVSAGLNLQEQTAVIRNSQVRLEEKVAAVLGAITQSSILILDGFEELLDTNGRYFSKEMQAVIDALATLEHKAKTLVTTRRLPQWVGKGTAGVEILNLGGLSESMAKALIQARAELTAKDIRTAPYLEALSKLHGHPMFIELFATAMGDLPAEQVVSELLTASDIGEYVVSQVLSKINESEMRVLRAAVVFRSSFTIDELAAVYGSPSDETQSITASLRILVRKAVLEVVDNEQKAYYLHPVLCDAIPRQADEEAVAHAAAAEWYLRDPIQPADLKTWDDGLYHLRSAAEVCKSEQFIQPYMWFVFDNEKLLEYSGWERRLISEYNTLLKLVTEDHFIFAIRFRLAGLLFCLKENEKALHYYELLSEGWGDPEDISPDVAGFYVLIKLRLGNILLDKENVEAARKALEHVNPIVAKLEDLALQMQILDLKFSVFDKANDIPGMLAVAKESLELAEPFEQSEDMEKRNWLAEAHFKMAKAKLRQTEILKNPNKVIENITGWVTHQIISLNIKIEIGRLAGVVAALNNFALIGSAFVDIGGFDEVLIGATLIAAEGINLQVQVVTPDWQKEKSEEIIQKFLSDLDNIERGREALMSISEKLLPYYNTALKQRSSLGVL